jgi:magnesium-protoporphyrin O-methyltransferase
LSGDCCQAGDVNALEQTFDQPRAAADARDYRDHGLNRRDRRLLSLLASHRNGPATVLEIGCGAGAFHQELLRRGLALKVTAVDASSAYLQAAKENATTFGLTDRVTYHHADFARSADAFASADVVVMNRVICCYPDLAALLVPGAERAGTLLLITVPLDNWWLRLPFWMVDAALTLFGSGYHPYIHRHRDIVAIARAGGLELAQMARHGLWRILLFDRR